MNSPEPASPISEDSSDSPGDLRDEVLPLTPPLSQEPSGSYLQAVNFSGFGGSGGSSGKRRAPLSGSFGPGSSARDAKSRRREDFPMRRGGGPPINNPWQSTEMAPIRSQRGDELLDHQQVERLRAAWGDPFDDTALKAAS